MKATKRVYDFDQSDRRLNEILNAGGGEYEELDYIPDRSRLTYSNGFYVNCSAIFIDIRGSSSLPHTRPVLGKIYRAYISETIAVLNSYDQCKEVFIVGDCVSAIFEPTPVFDDAFNAACALNSVVEHLNWRLSQKGYSTLSCGIGVSYGRVLMLKSGFDGSGINEIVWMGKAVNEASNLCHKGSRHGHAPIQVSTNTRDRLCIENQGFLTPIFSENLLLSSITHYQGNVVRSSMQEQLEKKKRFPNSLRDLGATLLTSKPVTTTAKPINIDEIIQASIFEEIRRTRRKI